MNNNPQITSSLKRLLNNKKKDFKRGDGKELRRVQRDLRVKLRKCKDSYRRKLEVKVEQNEKNEKQITGFKVTDRQPVSNLERANEVNLFTSFAGLVHSPPHTLTTFTDFFFPFSSSSPSSPYLTKTPGLLLVLALCL